MEMTPDEVRAYIDANPWTPLEEATLQADIERREALIYDERTAALVKQLQERERERQAKPSPSKHEAGPMTQPTDAWALYIKRALDSRERSMLGAIADVLAPIQKEHKAALDELRRDNETLREAVTSLCIEVAELRGLATARAEPSMPKAAPGKLAVIG